jgi:hypothetical protein
MGQAPLTQPGRWLQRAILLNTYQLCSHFTLFLRRENEGAHPQFDFSKLKLVQKARFVELCWKYGWEGKYPALVRLGGRLYRG